MTCTIHVGDCRTTLRSLPAESVNCVVTSPPYFGLRDYGVEPSIWGGESACQHEWNEERWYTEQGAAKSNGSGEAFSKPGEANKKRLKDARWRTAATCNKCSAWRGAMGLEQTPQMFIENTVAVFKEIHRVLKSDGTVWLNLGDSYAGGGCGARDAERWPKRSRSAGSIMPIHSKKNTGLANKQRLMIPSRVALALQADGWWLRDEIIWHKPNPMPVSVTDRTTPAHEMIYMLTKSARYYYDMAAIKEPMAESSIKRLSQPKLDEQKGGNKQDQYEELGITAGSRRPNEIVQSLAKGDGKRQPRSVWSVATKSFKGAHFATFPTALIEPCIKAGCPVGGTVLDPFGGAGTTAVVAEQLGRDSILCELNPEYADIARTRIGLCASIAKPIAANDNNTEAQIAA